MPTAARPSLYRVESAYARYEHHFSDARKTFEPVLLARAVAEVLEVFPDAKVIEVHGEYGEDFGADDTLRVHKITLPTGAVINEETHPDEWGKVQENADPFFDYLCAITGDDYLGFHEIIVDEALAVI